MRDILLARLSPFSQLLMLLGIAILTGGLMSYIGTQAVKMLFGLDILAVFASGESMEAMAYSTHAQLVWLIFQHLGFFVIPALVFSHFMRSMTLGNYIFWPYKAPYKTIVIGIACFALAYPIVNLIGYWNSTWHLPESMAALENSMRLIEDQNMEFITKIMGINNLGGTLLSILAIAVIPAIGEELVFRGCVQRILANWFNSPHLGILISALLFSLLHFEFFGLLPRLLLGIVLGYIFYISKSIWAPILAHFGNNLFAYMSMKSQLQSGTALEDIQDYSLGMSELLVMLVCSLALFFVAKRFYSKRVTTDVLETLYVWDINKTIPSLSGDNENDLKT